MQQSIAWTDEAGKCFFLEMLANGDEAYNNGQHENGGSGGASSADPREIKLQQEININGLEKSIREEHNGDPDAMVQRVQNASDPGDAIDNLLLRLMNLLQKDKREQMNPGIESWILMMCGECFFRE